MDVEEGIEMEVEALDEHDLIDEDLVEYEEEDASDEETTIIYQEDVEEEGQVYIEEDDYDEEEMVETALPPPAKNAINSLEKKTNITIKRVDNNKPQVTTQLVQQPKQIIKRLDNGKVVIVQQSVSVPRILNASAPSTITTPSTSVKSTPPYTFVKKEDGSFVKVNKQAPTTPTQVVKTMVSTTSEGGQIVRKVIVKQAPAQQIRASVPERQVLNAVTKKPVSPVPVSSKATTPKLVFQQGGKTIIAKPSATSSGTPQKIVLSQQQLKAGQASGEIQAINIPGKGIQYVRLLNKVDAASKAAEKNENIIKIGSASTPKTYGKQIASPQKKTNVALSKQLEGLSGSAKIVAVVKKDGHSTETDTSKVSSLTTTQLNQLQGAQIITGANNTKIVMLPSDYLEQLKKIQVKKPVQIKIENDSPAKSPNTTLDPDLERFKYGAESDGYKKRACNCTKSQCLKLYCDCFANGEFCYNCNCKDCFNNLENEDERQKAIRATLERNPLAFKPKIGATISDENDMLRKHTKGCNCKRSGCLKNYCECYEAKIVCGHNCKCVGCRNTEDNIHNFSTFSNEPMGKPVNLNSGMKRKSEDSIPPFPPNKQPYNFMTPDVIEATVQCMIAQADECQKRGCSIRTAERMILEEFGRCLVEIIDFSGKNDS